MVTGFDSTGIQVTSASTMVLEHYGPSSSLPIDISQVDSLDGNVQRELMNYKCKVCGYDQMPAPPIRHNICPCCGTEYGLDDDGVSYEELRNEWLRSSAPWFSTLEPYVPIPNWNAWDQLDIAGYSYAVPRPESGIRNHVIQVPAWNGHMIQTNEHIEWVN
jgi:hypothetical protein